METAVGDGLAFTGTGIGHIAIWTMYRIKKAEEPKPLEQSGMCILQDAQWCILRGAKQTAVIAKGGNNGESHNHNDVGSFQYLADGEAFLDDLGAGEYTKDYFSENVMRFSVIEVKATIFRSLEMLIKRQERNTVPTDLN